MPTWVAILISAAVTLAGVLATWGTLGTRLRDKRDADVRWKERVDTDRESFSSFMARVDKTLQQIQGSITAILIRLGPPSLATNESPVVLNELGRKVSEAMGVKAWATETAPTLVGKVAGLKEHRVYEFCTEHAENMELTEEQEDLAKELAYEHGFIPAKVRTAYAIELRDALLALRETEPDE